MEDASLERTYQIRLIALSREGVKEAPGAEKGKTKMVYSLAAARTQHEVGVNERVTEVLGILSWTEGHGSRDDQAQEFVLRPRTSHGPTKVCCEGCVDGTASVV
jgi:hypothetical protein